MAKLYGEIGASALMTFDKSFSRSNGQPLDSTEVFYSKKAAETYAAGEVAYVGQKIVVVETENEVTKVTHYGIEPDNSLKELGSSPVGDETTIVVAEDGTVSLAGVSGLEFTEKNENGEDVAVTYQPLLTSAGLTWVKPSATTVEGLATEIEGLKTKIGALEAADTTMGGQIATMEASVASLELTAHEHENKDELDLIASGDKAKWDAAAGDIAVVKADYLKAADKYDDTALAGRVKAIEDDYLKAADKTELQGNIDENADAIAAVKEDVDAFFKDADLTESAKDTLKELQEYIKSDETAASAMTASIKQNTDAIDAIEADYLKAADKEELQGNIDAMGAYVGDLPEGSNASTVIGYVDEVIAPIETKLEGIEEGAQVNEIETVSDEFTLSAEKNLSIKAVAMDKVTGLDAALAGKVDVVEGSRLITTDEATKLEKLVLGEDGSVAVSGTIAAGNVDGLADWITNRAGTLEGLSENNLTDEMVDKLGGIAEGAQVNVIDAVSDEFALSDDKTLSVKLISMDKIDGLPSALAAKVDAVEGKQLSTEDFTTSLLEKLNGIAEGAQVNVIESVLVDGVALEVSDKAVTIPGALQASLGLVKGTDMENGVSILEDHTMTVNSLNVNRLVQTEGETLVLDGGNAAGN